MGVHIVRGFLRLGGALMALAVPVIGVEAAELAGRLVMVGESQRARPGDLRHSVIYFTPRGPTAATTPGTYEVFTVKKEFRPRVLAVPVGSTVRFPNEDRILHNVFSVSGRNRFDLGLYRAGETRETTFENPGLVRVYCNVHHSMAAYVVVLTTPHFTSADARGSFRLTGLPAGAGTLTVWHERARSSSQAVEVPLERPLLVSLEVTRSRLPRHLNKFGKPYSRNGRRDYE